MGRKRFEDMDCGVAQALEQVGDWWTLLIVRDCLFGVTRFDDFQTDLGIARNILTDRLRKLVEHEILEKRLKEGSEKSYEYHLTRKGRDLWLVLTALRLWSDKWVFGKGNEPYVVREKGSRRTVKALRAVDGAGRVLDPKKLHWARGPSADEDGAPKRNA